MRYRINFDRIINQFSTYYLSGRKLILYLQALVKPLQTINNEFAEWAKETKIEATMTSQIIKLEWFLNRKFDKYFLDNSQHIFIKNGKRAGVAIYSETANIPQEENLLLKYESEDEKNSASLHYNGELTDENECSFFVYSPKIDARLLSEEAYVAMITYHVDKYKISGKTFKVKFNS
jgi:hypothetical protein